MKGFALHFRRRSVISFLQSKYQILILFSVSWNTSKPKIMQWQEVCPPIFLKLAFFFQKYYILIELSELTTKQKVFLFFQFLSSYSKNYKNLHSLISTLQLGNIALTWPSSHKPIVALVIFSSSNSLHFLERFFKLFNGMIWLERGNESVPKDKVFSFGHSLVMILMIKSLQ